MVSIPGRGQVAVDNVSLRKKGVDMQCVANGWMMIKSTSRKMKGEVPAAAHLHVWAVSTIRSFDET